MNKKTIIPVARVIFSIVCAYMFFMNWNAEALFKQDETPVTINDIEEGGAEDFTGSAAGEDIPRLTGAADFLEISYNMDYVTAEPVGIVPTGVYSLKPWVSRYNTHTYKGRTSTGSRKADVITSNMDIFGNYNQYYILELPDRTFILAQISDKEADAIANGSSVTLNIGQKVGMTDIARSRLAAVCGEYGVNMDGVFYNFDNKWQKEHHLTLLLLRFGVAAMFCFLLAAVMTLSGNKIFRVKKLTGRKGDLP